ncbi:MAG TPA: aminoglycoside phosphotransferase family protein [Streptosporangiaceae bacterium]
MRRLAGGTHASTHLVTTASPEREVVLRRFPPGDEAASAEARVLTALGGLDGFAPTLLAADLAGQQAGRPAVLITRLPGQADIMPAQPDGWAAQLGHALARVHAVPVGGLAGFRDVMDGETSALAGAPRVLTHFDYWSGNVLWESGVLSGVVDWSGAALAPRGFDLGWCRLDLALLFGDSVAADLFLAAYQDACGLAVGDMAQWDLHATLRSRHDVEDWLPNYHDLGRTDLSRGELRRRHSAWARRRLGAL